MTSIAEAVISIRITLSAMAAPNGLPPGRPRSLKIAIGMVGADGRAMNAVAPNSPIEIANANAPPTRMARSTSGKSTVHHAVHGRAPSVAAASLSVCWTLPSVGVVVRTTNGMATSAWAIGMRMSDARRSMGQSSAMRNPNPIVTAEVPSGNIRNTSSDVETRREVYASAALASTPITRAMSPAIAANSKELAMAVSGSVNAAL